MTATTESRSDRALTSRGMDFWLLGGASVLVWAAMIAAENYRQSSWAVDHHFANLAAISATLALVCNYPHFMASYKLAYLRGWTFISRFWFQLVLVPILLAAALWYGYRLYQSPAEGHELLASANAALNAIGLETNIGKAPTFGIEIMGLLINFMFFTVGWHYSKQTYGCMMVYAAYDGYRLSSAQRRLLKFSVFMIWGTSYCFANLESTAREFQEIPYASLGLPAFCYYICVAGFALGMLGVASLVVMRNFLRAGQRPSANFLVPYVAFALWWFPPLVQWDYFFLVVPFFHSLQYLGFVYKIEHERLADQHPGSINLRRHRDDHRAGDDGLARVRLAAEHCGSRHRCPLDAQHLDLHRRRAMCSSTCTTIFIDNVLWRFSNDHVREYVLA